MYSMFSNFGIRSVLSAQDKSKIFRPWDNETTQDSTVSTTTSENDEKNIKETVKENSDDEIKQLKAQHDTLETTSTKSHSLHDFPLLIDGYSAYPDLIQTNIAHSLGLAPTDPLFLESLSQGYALEEYARVLSQEQQSKMLNRKQRPKKYKCPHCDVGFSNNGQLKGHIRIHTGERPFKCDEKECGKTFTRNEELTRHKRIHSGLRPFPCSQCGKRFGRKDHLKKHTRTHMQPRGLYAVPVMLPFEAWNTAASYPYVPMYGF